MTKLTVKFKKSEKEKGVALLFTLVMLSLLLVLSLSFALDSMFEQKAAYNSANSSSASFLTRSQMKQVMLLIENNQDTYDNSRLYSYNSNTLPVISGYNHTDMLRERLPVSDVLEETDYCLNPDNNPATYDTPKVKWNYITDGTDNRIIGRTAFVVIPDDKVPLDSLIDQRVTSTNPLDPNYSIYPKHNEMNDEGGIVNPETRIGKYVSEINIRDVIPTALGVLGNGSGWEIYYIVNDLADALNLKGITVSNTVPGFTNGKYKTEGWSTFDSLFSTLQGVIGQVFGTVVKDDFKNNLSLTIAKDAEAFWADTDPVGASGEIDSSELYKRFDLTRSDWSTSTTNAGDLTFIRTVLLLDSANTGAPVQSMQTWDNIDSDSSSVGLPWLAAFAYNADGTLCTGADLNSWYASVAAHRYQIAANLKDYCDTDSRPTSDVDPVMSSTTNWKTTATHPIFTGNERTPYINKIGIKVDIFQTQTGPTGGGGGGGGGASRGFGKNGEGYLVDLGSSYLVAGRGGGGGGPGGGGPGGGGPGGGGPGGGGGGSTYEVSANVDIYPTIELINMYGTNWSGEDLTVYMEGTVSVETIVNENKVNENKVNQDIDFVCFINVASSEWSNGYSKLVTGSPVIWNASISEYEDVNTSVLDTQPGMPKNTPVTGKVTEFIVKKVVLHNGTVIIDNNTGKPESTGVTTAYDYTQKLTSTKSVATNLTSDRETLIISTWCGFAVHDPRQNLHEQDWKKLTPAADTIDLIVDPNNSYSPENAFSAVEVVATDGSKSYFGRPNADNVVTANRTEGPNILGAEVDTEVVTDPSEGGISTAFIRNAPMESPWELGFIHRATRWQTINLKAYDTAKAYQTITIGSNKYIPGGGVYSAGDANILDQIKMTASAKSPQKINLKLQRAENFTALFSKIKLGCAINQTTMSVSSMAGINPASGTELPSSSIPGLASAIDSQYDNGGRTRAAIANDFSAEADVLGYKSDGEVEELIGKTINLTKVGGTADRFTLIVLAQSIKDIGGTAANPINISKYSDNGDIQSENCVLGQFDAYINTSSNDLKDNVYFDEISAEQKIQVECERGIDGTIKITSFKYID